MNNNKFETALGYLEYALEHLKELGLTGPAFDIEHAIHKLYDIKHDDTEKTIPIYDIEEGCGE